jgi:alcohol dehydrogenase
MHVVRDALRSPRSDPGNDEVVLSRPFFCPTKVVEGEAFATLAALLRGRRFFVVTSAGWLKRGLLDRLWKAKLNPDSVLAEVDANPTLAVVERLALRIPNVEVAVALGGGSVIDATKAAVALEAIGHDRILMRTHLELGNNLPTGLAPLPLIAIPTTAGTGSEVTCWGTIWGESLAKHSVSDPSLYPTYSILDSRLLLSMPRSLALASGLDALSHAMEAVWNRHHGVVTDALAQSAIALLYRYLAPSLDEPDSLVLKKTVQTAALLAGLAMSTTQTALAHSLSYPLTSGFGLPHGIACSFTLPEIARYNLLENPERLVPIARALDCGLGDIPDALQHWFDDLGVPDQVARYVTPSAIERLGDKFITPARATNNIRDVDSVAARQIVIAALDPSRP